MNRVGEALRRAGLPLLRLEERALLERAARSTGLSDFGDGRFREPLRVLLAALEGEARLTPLGRVIARRDLTRLLCNGLHFQQTRTQHPEIAAGEVRAPIFILGLPRTGTTILHDLLSQDPANRVPLTWEAMHPWPPPEREHFEDDPRIDEAERHFAGIDRLVPEFRKMHGMGARLPQECVILMSHDLTSLVFHTTHRVPSYQAWLDRLDWRPVYASHRWQLQYLQWRCPAERWVLKSPTHLWTLDALLDVYPDARIVQTHRDPLRVISSLVSLVTLLRSLSSDRVDAREIGADWTERLARGLAAAIRVREARGLDERRVFDLHYDAFVGNEVETIRRIYEQFGLELGAEAEARMRRHLAANPKDRHGAHRYELAGAGLDPESERRRYAFYQERFGIAPEPV